MSGHGHSHSHGGGGGGCDHGQAGKTGEEMGLSYSLYQKIDMTNLTCLNEEVEDSGKTVFKPWESRLDREKFVVSDADEELLINIPFTGRGRNSPTPNFTISHLPGNVKLKGIIVGAEDDDSAPDKVKLYKNRPNMSFDDAGACPEQEFSLVRDSSCSVQYSVKTVSFSSVHHLTLHFPSNFGAEQTKIFYIGLAGEFSQANRVGVVNCVYEARPMMEDHKTEEKEKMFGGSGPAF